MLFVFRGYLSSMSCRCTAWTARYTTWLLTTLTPKGIVFSFLADAQAVGQILQDLSLAYHEQEVPCRQESRLRWQQIIAQSVGLLSSTAQPSGITSSSNCAAKCTQGLRMLLLFTSGGQYVPPEYLGSPV